MIVSVPGAVELWQLEEERSKFNCFFQYPAHEDVVSSVSVFHTKDKALSGSNDRRYEGKGLAFSFVITTIYLAPQLTFTPSNLE